MQFKNYSYLLESLSFWGEGSAEEVPDIPLEDEFIVAPGAAAAVLPEVFSWLLPILLVVAAKLEPDTNGEFLIW